MVETFVQFIDVRGGPAAISRATGHGAGAVALWRHRNKVPRTAWPELIEAFPDVSIGDLKRIEMASGAAPAHLPFVVGE